MTEAANLLTLTPVRRADWEAAADGRVVVRIPKFRGRAGRWLMPRLRRPYFNIRLDALGSVVWRHCDGQTPVSTIAEHLTRELGAEAGEPDALLARIAAFLRHLERGDLVTIARNQE
jgi:hypothetical protein